MSRPTSVTVFAVLNVMYGLLNVLGVVATFVFMMAAPDDPLYATWKIPVMSVWMPLRLTLAGIAAAALIPAGVGLFLLRGWARRVSIAYGIYSVAVNAIDIALQFTVVIFPLLRDLHSKRADESIAYGMLVGVMFGALFGLIYPLLLWYCMMRPHVVAAFDSVALDSPANDSKDEPVNATLDWNPVVPRAQDAISHNPFASPHAAALPPPRVIQVPDVDSHVSQKGIIGTNPQARLAACLGALAVFPCLGFPLGAFAIVCGIRGVRYARKTPQARGELMSWFGIVMGTFFGLLNFLLGMSGAVLAVIDIMHGR